MLVDIDSVRCVGKHGHIRTQRLVHRRCNLIGRAVCGVQYNFHSIQTRIDGIQQILLIYAKSIFHRSAAAHVLAHVFRMLKFLGQDDVFDFFFDSIVQLEALSVENLNSVVLKGIMRCGDYHSGICLVVPH